MGVSMVDDGREESVVMGLCGRWVWMGSVVGVVDIVERTVGRGYKVKGRYG